MSCKMLIFKAVIDFPAPTDNYQSTCWKCVDQYGCPSPTHIHMMMTILKSSMASHGIDVSKNQFRSRMDFSQGIDSVESMQEPEFLNF
jgi:hypothetical protein